MKAKYFELAKKVASLSEHPKHKLGAVLVSGNKILSIGINKLKTHPKSTHPYQSLHAEMHAILAAKTDLSDADLYVYRATKTGKMGLSKPCLYCQIMIKESNIKNVFYTSDDKYEKL